ncbi:MAG: hypothetical protein Q8P18_12095 [Pseudomonadota bacterium]|nr:hypothetical protein [Pseudomonadota bacterium]
MSLLEAASQARHDLGKYISFQARWIEPGAPIDTLRDALREDLLRTRKGPDGVFTAAALWRALREPLIPLGIDRVDALMEVLTVRAAALDTLDEASLLDTARLAREVADELRAVHARARSGKGEGV